MVAEDIIIKPIITEKSNDAMQEGIAITDMENGGISAISGGRNYGARGTNRATTKRLY